MTKWAVTFFVGFTVGLLAFGIETAIDVLTDLRRDIFDAAVQHGSVLRAFGLVLGVSGGFLLCAVVCCLFVSPAASGSGVGLVMGYLNGVHIPELFSGKTLFSKVCYEFIASQRAQCVLTL